MKKNLHESDIPNPPRKPRLLLVGEGPADIGREAHPGGTAAGFLHASLMGSQDEVDDDQLPFSISEIRQWKSLRFSPPRRKKKLSFEDVMALDSEGGRVLAALVLAASQELDGVFVLKDCEQNDRFDLQDRLRNARTTFEANDALSVRPRLIVATPSRAQETWLLADQEAVKSVFGSEGIYKFSKSAEARTDSSQLKAHIDEHSKRCRLEPYQARRRLAFRAAPETLAARCPRCYPEFINDVNRELRPLMSHD